MKVQITDPAIPEGYSFRRCDDTYTRDEFVIACSLRFGVSLWNLPGEYNENPHAVRYAKKHPKEFYTDADVREVMKLTFREESRK